MEENEIEFDIPEGLMGLFTKMTFKEKKPSHGHGHYNVDWDKSYLSVKI